MQCPICGAEPEKLIKVELEGALIEVCELCAKKYGGKIIKEEKVKRPAKHFDIEEMELLPNYNELIKQRREKLGLTRKQLAERIKEKESVIKRIEEGKMTLDEKLAEKLKMFLNIELFYRPEERKVKKKTKKAILTIGDIAVIK